MLACFIKFRNDHLQEDYDDYINHLDIRTLSCPHCNSTMHYHGTYERIVFSNGSFFKLKLQRVYCRHCKRSNVLFPSYLIPYRRVSIFEVLTNLNNLDKELKAAFKSWVNLVSNYLELTIDELTLYCVKHFSKQFLQTHNGELLFQHN